MIRYAAHRIYLLSERQLLVRKMVELDDEGFVSAVSPFSGEVHHTIWVDGIILLCSVQPDSPWSNETLEHYADRISIQSNQTVQMGKRKMRAYQISGFDIPAMTFKAVTRVILLH